MTAQNNTGKMAIPSEPKNLARKLAKTDPSEYVVGSAARAGLKKFGDKHPRLDHEAPFEDGEDAVFNGTKISKEKTTRRADYEIGDDVKAYESVDKRFGGILEKVAKYNSQKTGVLKGHENSDYTKIEVEGDGEDTVEPQGKFKTKPAVNSTWKEETELAEGSVKCTPAMLERHLNGADAVKNTKGNIRIARRFGYYKHGSTSDGHAKNISGQLEAMGIKHEIVDHGTQDYKPFNDGVSIWKQNHHWVDVKIHPGQKIVKEGYLAELGEPMSNAPATSDSPGWSGDSSKDTGDKNSEQDKGDKNQNDTSTDGGNQEAKDMLEQIATLSAELFEDLPDDMELPSWMGEKLKLAHGFIKSIHDKVSENADGADDDDEKDGNPEGNVQQNNDAAGTSKPSAFKESVAARLVENTGASIAARLRGK